MSNKPLILGDNLFENVILHPSYVLGQSGADDAGGHTTFRVADNLRDMTYWTPQALNAARTIYVDAQAAVTPNTIILDRGHNLYGVTVSLRGYTDTTFSSSVLLFTSTIPSTPGGLNTDANGCLTPDGVWWKTFTPQSARVPALVIPAMGAGIGPIITGLYLGTNYRFTEFLNAPGAYDYGTQVKYMRNEMSRGGVRSKSRAINLDRITINIHLDSTDYNGFDAQVRRLLRYNHPWWFCLDDSDATGCGLMRLFQTAADVDYSPQVNPVHREIQLMLEEVIPSFAY